MVISKDGKRKRKNINSPALGTLPELPKRIKVHAQRKFAQGQGASTFQLQSMNLSSTSSQTSTPNKDSRDSQNQSVPPPPELITHKRPNTEDFLTFLCFRGTPSLPIHLDYFNTNNRSATGTSSATSSTTLTPPTDQPLQPLSGLQSTSVSNIEASASNSKISSNSTTNPSVVIDKLIPEQPVDLPSTSTSKTSSAASSKDHVKLSEISKEPPVFIPFGVRKRAEQQPDRVNREKVQALRKKYHEQRIAKLKSKGCYTKTRSSVQTRSNLNFTPFMPTPSSDVTESCGNNIEVEIEVPSPIFTTPTKSKIQKAEVIEKINETSKRKIGLRSGGGNDSNSSINIEISKPNTIKKNVEKKPIKKKGGSIKTPEEPKECDKIIEKPKKINKTKSKISEVKSVPATRQTRQIKFSMSSNTKSSQEEQPEEIVKYEKTDSEEFSSDDDEPLAIAIIKKSTQVKNANIVQKVEEEPKVTRSKKIINKTVKPISPPPIIGKLDVKSISLVNKVTEQQLDEIVVQQELKLANRKKEILTYSKEQQDSSENDEILKTNKPSTSISVVPIPKRVYKKRKFDFEFEKPAELSQATTTDQSEPETRTPRPSRKTKEAATIYMELIGRKLTSNENDVDNDNDSNDSFPELPNVRKTQQMENEMKEQYNNKNNKKVIGGRKTKPLPINKNSDSDQNNTSDCNKVKVRKKTKSVAKEIQKKVSPVKEKVFCNNKLEKSFSDSDEEPLAVKVLKKKNIRKSPSKQQHPQTLQSQDCPQPTQKLVIPEPPVVLPPPPNEIISIKKDIKLEESDIKLTSSKLLSPIKQLALANSFVSNNYKSEEKPFGIGNKTEDTSKQNILLSPFTRTAFNYDFTLKDDVETSTKVNRSSDFNSKSLDDTSPTKLSKSIENENNDLMKKLREVEELAILKSENSAKQPKLTTSNTLRDLMNPLPSFEESGKIFGIASVSLAQSSGPLDTKCTLGKCGSIHKPPLGPVVPTEALLGEQLSSKERRRAKVNMTHEQIQKWLVESCVTPDPDVLSYDFLDFNDIETTPKPVHYGSTKSPFKDEEQPTTSSSRTIKSKPEKSITNRDKSSSSVTKGPSLKAKPVLVKEDTKREANLSREEKLSTYQERISKSIATPSTLDSYNNKNQLSIRNSNNNNTSNAFKANISDNIKLRETQSTLSSNAMPTAHPIDLSSSDKLTKSKEKDESKPLQSESITTTTITSPAPVEQQPVQKSLSNQKQTPTASTQTNKKTGESSVSISIDNKPNSTTAVGKLANNNNNKSNTTTKSKQNQINQKPNSISATDRKLIFNQRRTPVYNTKIPETSKTKSIVNTFGAFSPENETSIYSFDKEDDVMPVAAPFRRQSRRESNDNSRHEDSNEKFTTQTAISSKKEETSIQSSKQKQDNVTPKKRGASQPEVSLTLSPEDNTKSASIAVQVSLDQITASNNKSKKNSTDKPTDNNDSDSEGHTFYIPLQGGNITGGKNDQIIQGVAVKLGTEGPEGPNQRVIMHAKLVTKTSMGSTSTPLPESMGNVQELVKSLIAGKEASGSKSVPIGTVQPRFKSSESVEDPAQIQHPQPSQQTTSTSQLARVNSNSSIFSQKLKYPQRARLKHETPAQAINNTTFPIRDDPAQMVDAPIFRPTEKEFADPMEYIERIATTASRFGLCKIIPPASFKPDCQLSDEIRFNAYNQYVHKMLNRWGPNTKELCAIKKYLLTQSITMTHPPWIGGMEVDLPRLYHTVQELGGLKDVIEKKKWTRVAEEMCIPKTAHDRVTKLDDIYCKYLLPYDTLSPAERQKLFDEVEADWAKREAKARHNADRCVNGDGLSVEGSEDDDESEDAEGDIMECMLKGRSMPLSAFFRIARNTMSVWFKNSEPDASEIEAEFWRHVAVRDCHICVHSGSIDSSGWGYGFPTPGPKSKSSPCAKHPWNLKVLTNHSGSVLRSLGPVMGVTVPTLQFGMLFSACCWYRDPHGLPWIEYLHTGSSKIWYGVPDDQSANLRSALIALVPTHCQNKTIWLPSDTAMVPPHMLTDRNVSLCRTEQMPGEFVVVFPRAYTSSVCTGYVVSESVYFATNSWLETAKEDFKDIQDSCEPAVFSLEQLLFAISSDTRSNYETLVQILPMVMEMYEREVTLRRKVKIAGITKTEKLVAPKKGKQQSEEYECDICRANLYISMIKIDEESIYCIHHAIKYINNSRIQSNKCKLVYTYGIDEIEQMLEGLKERINQQKKKLNNKKQQQQQIQSKQGKFDK